MLDFSSQSTQSAVAVSVTANQGVKSKILGLVQEVSSLYPTLSDLEKTRSGIAAFVSGVYATGIPNIIDYNTINKDFSGDVLARAKYFSVNDIL